MDSVVISVLFLLVVAAAATWAIVQAVKRHHYVKELESFGWTFETSPSIAWTYGLNAPPFGLSQQRDIDDLIYGHTSGGQRFRVFEYSARGVPERRYVCVELPAPVPLAFVTEANSARVGAPTHVSFTTDRWTVTSYDTGFGAALTENLAPQLPLLGALGPVDLSFDGMWVVACGVPEAAPLMRDYIEAVARVAWAAAPLVGKYATGSIPEELSFFGHPEWTYRVRCDELLTSFSRATTDGFNHRLLDVIFSANDGLSVRGARHTWDTRRTEYYTDSEGRTQTRVVTDHHSEELCEVDPPLPFVDIEYGRRGWKLFAAPRCEFESIAFNEQWEVRCHVPKFASDVFHPRMLEWLLAHPMYGFRLHGGRMSVDIGASADLEALIYVSQSVHDFFGRVPDFVWEDLGHARTPVFRSTSG